MPPTTEPTVPLRKQPTFLLFTLARVGTRSGAQIMSVAIGWQMYTLTGNPLDLGLVALTEFIPAVALMLVGGHVADRYGRRRISRIAQLAQALLAVALAAAGSSNAATPLLLYALVFNLGAARAFEAPALQALLPQVVATHNLPRAVATSSAAMQCAGVVAPVIGGLAYAAGAPFAYGLCAVLFSGAAVAMSVLDLRDEPPALARQMTRDSLLAGLRHARGNPLLLGVLSLDFLVVLLGSATALLPVFARDLLAAGPAALGLLRAAPAAGALAMAVWLAHRPLSRGVGRKLFAAAAVFGMATIALALSDSLMLALAALSVIGASDMLGAVIRSTLVQLETADELRGRVSALNALVAGSANQLGDFESGLAAAWLGARPAVVLGGVSTLFVCALWMHLFPGLYRRDRLTGDREGSPSRTETP